MMQRSCEIEEGTSDVVLLVLSSSRTSDRIPGTVITLGRRLVPRGNDEGNSDVRSKRFEYDREDIFPDLLTSSWFHESDR